MAFHVRFPCQHLAPCSYVLDRLRGLFAQPTPWVLSGVVNLGLYGSGAQDLLLCSQDEHLCAVLQPSPFKVLVEFLEIRHFRTRDGVKTRHVVFHQLLVETPPDLSRHPGKIQDAPNTLWTDPLDLKRLAPDHASIPGHPSLCGPLPTSVPVCQRHYLL
ncbi:hypothetical protein WMY93_021304 [Mugilogobius chulae]|uniref:Uncharacterized protein n=1 Tax=Mugilogobius chulae TaxID=88201 RepID=A0AAW0NEX3_9GOBI